MKLAICGYPPMAFQVINALQNTAYKCKYFIRDLMTSYSEENFKFPQDPPIKLIKFFQFRRLIDEGKLDGLLIADFSQEVFLKVVRMCKLYNIPNVGIVDFSFISNVREICFLNNEKAFMPQLETNLIDSCNLNCKACTHYSNLFTDSDIYPLENYARDLRQISNNFDILIFYILGGEPFKQKNLDEYLKITRHFLPNTNLHLVTNGLLVPKVSQKILDSLRENNFKIEVSMYPPTVKMIDRIVKVFEENHIPCNVRGEVHFFNSFLTLHGGHNPERSRAICVNDNCRFLRNGKIYKCPVDALSYKLVEHFGLKGFPKATGVDIFAKNVASQIEQLYGNIELCTWCSETCRVIQWTPENNPQITDWLANPEEAATLQN